MAYDGVLEGVGQTEVDGAGPPVSGPGFGQGLLALVVRPDLIAAHPPGQPLALPQGQRVQQALLYLHVLMAEHLT